jgi:hypothetical protein
VWLPEEGDDVAVLFSKEGKPWVVGSWYAADRLESGNVELPEYEEGDLRVGNSAGSHVTLKSNGDVEIEAAGEVYINDTQWSTHTHDYGTDNTTEGVNE